jgi:uncharacterized membrane protein YgcG
MLILRRIGLLPALLVLLVAMAGQPGRAQAAERILSFVSDVRIERNGDLEVTETIAVDAENDQIRRGILRDFPTIYRTRDGRRVEVGFTVRSVMRDGRAETYTLEKLANGVRVRIGRADAMLSTGRHEFAIRYRTTRQIGYFPEFDELYWNVTGTGWTFPIDVAEVRITLPERVPFIRSAVYTGPQGANGRDAAVVEEEPGRIVFRTTRPLPLRNGLTVAAAWRKGVLDPPPGPSLFERAGDWIVQTWVYRHLPLVLAMIGLPLVLGYYLYAWLKIGGAPRRGVVIPLFTPPEGMSAAATRYVRRMKFDDKTLTAALIELAVNGRLKLIGSTVTRGKHKGDDKITIEKRDGGKPVGAAEELAVKRLFHSRASVPLTQASSTDLRSAMNGLKDVLRKTYDNVSFRSNASWAGWGLLASFVLMAVVVAANWTGEHDLFGSTLFVLLLPIPALMLGLSVMTAGWRAQGAARAVSLIVGVAFTTLGAIGSYWLLLAYRPDWTEVMPTVAAFALAPVAVFAFPLFKAPTPAGRKLMDDIEGFRLYLGVAEEDRLQAFYPPKKTPELFEKYLPYAVALDVENAWAKRFDGILTEAMMEEIQRSWYMSEDKERGDPGRLVNFVATSLAETVAAAATPPGSSGSRSGSSSDSNSSGSSGGGSSGGGGGGGGGSGW